MENDKNMDIDPEVKDEALDSVSGGIQAGPIVRDSFVDEFGNRYVRDENGDVHRVDQTVQPERKTSYL